MQVDLNLPAGQYIRRPLKIRACAKCAKLSLFRAFLKILFAHARNNGNIIKMIKIFNGNKVKTVIFRPLKIRNARN